MDHTLSSTIFHPFPLSLFLLRICTALSLLQRTSPAWRDLQVFPLRLSLETPFVVTSNVSCGLWAQCRTQRQRVSSPCSPSQKTSEWGEREKEREREKGIFTIACDSVFVKHVAALNFHTPLLLSFVDLSSSTRMCRGRAWTSISSSQTPERQWSSSSLCQRSEARSLKRHPVPLCFFLELMPDPKTTCAGILFRRRGARCPRWAH